MTQEQLNEKFRACEKARELNLLTSDGWGSNRHGDKDSLWDGNTGKHWERDHNEDGIPHGDWNPLP